MCPATRWRANSLFLFRHFRPKEKRTVTKVHLSQSIDSSRMVVRTFFGRPQREYAIFDETVSPRRHISVFIVCPAIPGFDIPYRPVSPVILEKSVLNTQVFSFISFMSNPPLAAVADYDRRFDPNRFDRKVFYKRRSCPSRTLPASVPTCW